MAHVDHCQTADDVRAAARRVYERRREYDARMSLRNQRPKLEIVPISAAQIVEIRPDDIMKGKPRGETLYSFVKRNEGVIRAILDREADHLSRAISIQEIQRAVCIHYGISRIDLVSQVRTRRCTIPRSVSFLLCRMLTPCSFPLIGKMHGDRDHTTVLSGYRKMEGVREKLESELRLSDPIEMWVGRAAAHLEGQA